MQLRRWLEDNEKKPVYSAKVFVHYSVDNKFSRRNIFEIYILERNSKQRINRNGFSCDQKKQHGEEFR